MNPTRSTTTGLRPLFKLLALCAPLALPPAASAAPIIWNAATTIAGDADVSNTGTFKYAYHWWNGGNQAVNGVTFTGVSAYTGTDFSLTSANFGGAGAYFAGTVAPFTSLSAAYKAILTGSFYNNGSAVTVTLKNLTAGNQYAVQIWGNDARIYGENRAQTVTSTGGNTVTVDYNSLETNGGVGQYTIGTFTADSATQTFTLTGISGTGNGAGMSCALMALQLRDLGLPTVTATPTFSLPAGTYIGTQTVTLNCDTPGATIHYTTDGSTPTPSSTSGTSGMTVGVTAGATIALNAYGRLDGFTDSAVASATYTALATVSGIWTNPAGGSWPAAANWQDSLIAFGATGDFGTLDLTSDAQITLDGARTMNQLVFGDTTPSHNWSLVTGSGDPLTLATLSGVTPAITVTNQTATLDLVLAGNQGLTKSGAGALTLAGANTYTGTTALNGGTLQVTNLASHRSAVVTATGTTFRAEVPTNVSAPYSFNITGTGTTVKTGAGNWLIGSTGRVGIAMSPGGLLDIQEGTVGTGSHQQSFTGNQGSIHIAAGATLDISAENIWADALTGDGSIIMSYGGSGARTVTVGVANASGTFSGVIGSATLIALNKTGTGTLILTGANTYTNTTTISGGTLQLGNGGTTGSLSTSSVLTNNGTLAFNRSDSISQGVQFRANAFGGTGGLTQMGPGTLTLIANNTYTGTTKVTGGTLAIGLTPGTKWTVNSLDLANGTTLALRNFNSDIATAPAEAITAITTAGTVTIDVSGNFTVGSYSLLWYPVGSQIGGTGFAAFTLGTLPRGVTATLVNDEASGAVLLDVTSVSANSQIAWRGNASSVWDVATALNWSLGGTSINYLNGDSVLFDDAATGTTDITLDTTVTPSAIAFDNTAKDYTLSGSGAISGNIGITKGGFGKLTINNPNVYTGASAVNAGTVAVTSLAAYRSSTSIATGATFETKVATDVMAANSFNLTGSGTLVKTGAGKWLLGDTGRVGIALGAGGLIDIREGIVSTGNHMQSFTGNQGSLNVATGATLDLAAENAPFDALTGVGTITNSYPPSGGRTVSVGVAGGGGTFAGTITSGVLALAKTGAGTQILTGASTYSLGTTVNNGVLLVNNTEGSGTGTGGVSVASAGTLGGSGTLTGSVNAAGTIAPVGTFRTGAVTFNGGSYACDLADADILAVTGNLTLTNATLAIHGTPTAPSYVIATYTGALTGTFNAPSIPGYSVNYGTGTNSEITLVASTSFNGWMAGFTFAEGADKTLTGDPDHDGIPNGVEMVLGGDPATGMNAALMPTLELATNPDGVPAGDYFVFTYRRAGQAVDAGLAIACETAAVLTAPWTKAENGIAGVVEMADTPIFNPPATTPTDRVRVYIPRNAQPKLFGRLNVAVP